MMNEVTLNIVNGLRKNLISHFCINFLCKALQNVVELGISKASSKKNDRKRHNGLYLHFDDLCSVYHHGFYAKKSWKWDRVGLN